ncbi:MAG: hypothetical protein IJU19_01525 [Bacteroidales bacterium]|nr:hypothetical protein [Bacteroidales bacterium]
MRNGIHILLFAIGLWGIVGASAQNCREILLPYFDYDADELEHYPAEKLDWHCRFARSAFFEADTVPWGMDVYRISDVKEKESGEPLPDDFKVDLSTMSYYAYNFADFQKRYRRNDVTICFETPGSAHPYLVLRSVVEMRRLADSKLDSNTDDEEIKQR